MFKLKTALTQVRPLVCAFRTLAVRPSEVLKRRFNINFTASRQYVAPVAAEPFLNGSNAVYMEEMYQAWLEDPSSVHKVGISM